MSDDTEKTCSKCGVTKSVGEYYWQIKGVRRLPRCKECHRADVAAHRLENKDKIAAYKAEYHLANREKISARNVEYNARDPQVKATAGAIERTHLTQDELFAGATRAEVNAEVRFDYILRNLLSEKTGIPYEVDHIKPICEGGVHRLWNLAIIPRSANRTKGAYWADEEYSDEYIEAEEEAIKAFNRELILTES